MKVFGFDWAYFEWKYVEKPLPVRIIMIIVLTDARLTYEIDQDPDIENTEHYHTPITYLTKHIVADVVLLSGTDNSKH